ncbi:MAG TPA: hypothetical protein VFY10_08980 [Dehalococcoidia bacterium]|nr:hypothetical protein [Dehalococcoidia bacterium]
MPPLQYLVANFVRDDFKAEILPELKRLSHKKIIRIIDVLLIRRRPNGDVVRQEFSEAVPGEPELSSAPTGEDVEWFTQDDVETVGELLPRKAAIIVVLFEHIWFDKLDDAVLRANQALNSELEPEALSGAIERYFIQREQLEKPARSTGLHHIT